MRSGSTTLQSTSQLTLGKWCSPASGAGPECSTTLNAARPSGTLSRFLSHCEWMRLVPQRDESGLSSRTKTQEQIWVTAQPPADAPLLHIQLRPRWRSKDPRTPPPLSPSPRTPANNLPGEGQEEENMLFPSARTKQDWSWTWSMQEVRGPGVDGTR
ncbi:uncharacterized protein V6R79_025547 [Siganus canaliculatus]